MVRTKLNCAADSHPGLVRTNNEDRVYHDADRGLFLVIDGVGGQAAGERAAAIAEMRIRRRLERQTGTLEQRVREAITVANNEIFDVAQSRPDLQGMACVLTLALIEDGILTVGHVGDSRLYKIRGGVIRKLTHDHSPVGEREDRGELTEREAMSHPRRNEVYRDVGSEQHTPEDADFIEIEQLPFESDSALILCSDGLSDQVASADILSTVQRHAGAPRRTVADLIEMANAAGGKDNVSIIIVEGDQFPRAVAAGSAAVPASKRPGRFAGRAAFLIYGLLLGLLVAAGVYTRQASISSKQPAVRLTSGELLTAGPGGAYRTIAEAMAAATAGDTVEVVGGEYRETVELKNGVTLRSRVPREAILRAAPAAGTPPAAGPAPAAVLVRSVRNARIVGFRILADAQLPLAAGILLENSDVEIEDLEISGARTGVHIRSGSATLRADYIHDNTGPGVLIEPRSSAWLSHNAILHNGADRREPRPDLDAGDTQPVLVGNVFSREQALKLPPNFALDILRKYNYFIEPAGRPPGSRRR